MLGKILNINAGLYRVLLESDEIVECRARGKFRNVKLDKNSKIQLKNNNNYSNKLDTRIVKLSPKVGDNVEVQINDGLNYIMDIHPRKNSLIRPDIANVDQILLVISAKEPDFSSYLLDLFLVNLEKYKIKPLIVISKTDLLTEEEYNNIKQIASYYREIGYLCFMVDSLVGKHTKEIIPYLENKLTVLSGQTGAGKSTFINSIIPSFRLETQSISKALGRGKHTTRTTTLYRQFNGLIGDTPGFSKLNLFDINEDNLAHYFIEFSEYNCKFRDCKHDISSLGCGVLNAVRENKILKSRYENYIKMYEDMKRGRK